MICFHVNTHPQEYDELSQLEENLLSRISEEEEEEEIFRMVQQKSLEEAHMNSCQSSLPSNQNYMGVPIMSPEMYAHYLTQAQARSY